MNLALEAKNCRGKGDLSPRFRRATPSDISMPSRGVLQSIEWHHGHFVTYGSFSLPALTKTSFRRSVIKKAPQLKLRCHSFLRRERDSNSRYPFGVHTLSRRASSATRASLRRSVRLNGTAKIDIFCGDASRRHRKINDAVISTKRSARRNPYFCIARRASPKRR